MQGKDHKKRMVRQPARSQLVPIAKEFNAIDLEGNGVLDANEIRVALRSVGEPEDVISNIVASMDLQRNGGSVQGVSWETFQAIMNAKE